MVRSLFERLDAGQLPPPVERKIEQAPTEKLIEPPPIEEWPPPRKVDHAQRLLDWLQRWDKPTVTARDIRIFGPHSGRTRELTHSSVEILVKHGWLVPLKVNQRNRYRWRIVRKRAVVHPVVAS
jgi:hypothetical protein